MSTKFEDIKKYYDYGMWTEDQVRAAVVKNKITAEEFKLITGRGFIG